MSTSGNNRLISYIESINRQVGCALTWTGTANLGETAGAVFVEWPDGRQSVVTLATISILQMRQTADVVEMLRLRDVPLPRHELIVELDNGVIAVVEERLPGRPAPIVDSDVIDKLVDTNELFADVLVGRPDVPIPPLYLSHSGAKFPRHETLEQHSARSQSLLRRIQTIGGQNPNEMFGYDLVHSDFTVPNILLGDNGQVTGVVDWNNGAFRGDRRFSLVKLLFDLTWDSHSPGGGQHHVQPSAIRRLETILHDTVEADLLRLYWAHWTLVMLHWTIRSGDPDVIELHLRLGERGLT